MHALVFFVLLVAFVIGLTMHHHLLREMRSRHPDLWESLGRPTLVINNSVSNGLAVQRFLWRKDYEALHDPEFILLARRLRTFNLAYLAFFAVILIGSLIEIFAPAFRTI
jgi:uncharacterized membrane protein